MHRIVDQLGDRFLEVVYSMLGKYAEQQQNPIVSYDVDGTPRTASELLSMLDAQVEEVRKGNYVTIEEFEKQSA